jgi:polyisoprenoid-binding protein YceI
MNKQMNETMNETMNATTNATTNATMNATTSATTKALCVATMCLALLLALPPVAGAERALVLDAETTQISIRLKATLHMVKGSFRLQGGEVVFDEESGAASGWIRVDADSGKTGIGARDRKMKGKVLESERYPEIVFTPTRFELGSELADGRELKLMGDLSIHGSEYPLTIPAKVLLGPGGEAKIDARFVIPYVKWGMRDVSNFISKVAPEVEVIVEGHGVIEERR